MLSRSLAECPPWSRCRAVAGRLGRLRAKKDAPLRDRSACSVRDASPQGAIAERQLLGVVANSQFRVTSTLSCPSASFGPLAARDSPSSGLDATSDQRAGLVEGVGHRLPPVQPYLPGGVDGVGRRCHDSWWPGRTVLVRTQILRLPMQLVARPVESAFQKGASKRRNAAGRADGACVLGSTSATDRCSSFDAGC
jgi:hypothetical protein